jgi:hypothetical protein
MKRDGKQDRKRRRTEKFEAKRMRNDMKQMDETRRTGQLICNSIIQPGIWKLVQRCSGTTAGLGYLEVNVICPCKSLHRTVD